MNDNDILVLGATGKTGRRVVRRLRAEGLDPRAASRSGDVRFEWERADTWKPALTGVRAVYLVAHDDPAFAPPFVDLAVAAGVRRFVVLSGRGIEASRAAGYSLGMAEAERAVTASGAEWTLLRPNNFNQNFDEDLWREPLRRGRIALPIGDVPEPFIDVEDIAEIAVSALTTDRHVGEVYELSGADDLSWRGAVEVIAGAAGREIRYEELTPERYRTELAAGGVPPVFIDVLDGLFALHRAGHTAQLADGVRRALGREPVPFADWAARAAAAGAWT
ncbi:NAD(P)H-binding protein [Streptomyces sp. MP131-18]|uniref:NAD(P)H-binding protein n=1 Tax=Streptomyces sp. MP131-18 TaxID=1857892 RepID=UPI00097C3B51|nr:NAD(P)H-binding protein [Streptomyces sp. MP131-18]ONK12301.1 NAD(P)H azoreductase [Streptomyces sp. MP131-18]